MRRGMEAKARRGKDDLYGENDIENIGDILE